MTKKREVEESLHQVLADLRQSQKFACLGSYRFYPKSGSWTCSEALDDIFGIGPDYSKTVEGWGALIHPEDRQEMLSYLSEEVIGKRKRFDREYRIVRPRDGREIWVHGWGDLEIGPKGEVATMFGAIQDITDRRRVEAAVRESEAELKALMASPFRMSSLSSVPMGVSSRSPPSIHPCFTGRRRRQLESRSTMSSPRNRPTCS